MNHKRSTTAQKEILNEQYLRVKSRHGLGQLSGTNLGTNISTCTRTCTAHQHQLTVGGDVSGVHVSQGGGQARADARSADVDAQTSSVLF